MFYISMLPMPQIYKIEPSRVIHELILKPLGTYLIRYATENDDILSQIQSNIKSTSSYVVLSVRVDENKYYCAVMNYRLPFDQSNEDENRQYLLEYYQNSSEIDALPDLIEECVIKIEDTNWKIEERFFQTNYLDLFSRREENMRCNLQDGSKVFKKLMKTDERELSILTELSYFHIVTFYGISYQSDQMKYLIFADHGESLKAKYPDIKFPNELMIKQLSMIGYQIACGMMYLESKYIIHRDLHAGNILIDENNLIRIADFEHAIRRDDDEETFQQSIKDSELKFQIRYLAPECLPHPPEDGEMVDSNVTLLNEFSSKSDVWAYGLIFIDLTINPKEHIYPDIPIECNDDEEMRQLVQYIKVDQKIHERPNDCPENLYNVLKQCWKYSRDDRISFTDIRNEMLRLFQSIEN